MSKLNDNGGYPVPFDGETDEDFAARFEAFTDRAAWYGQDS